MSRIHLTDPQPLRTSRTRRTTNDRCPQCGAGPTRRETFEGFGGHRTVCCQECGYDFQATGAVPGSWWTGCAIPIRRMSRRCARRVA